MKYFAKSQEIYINIFYSLRNTNTLSQARNIVNIVIYSEQIWIKWRKKFEINYKLFNRLIL